MLSSSTRSKFVDRCLDIFGAAPLDLELIDSLNYLPSVFTTEQVSLGETDVLIFFTTYLVLYRYPLTSTPGISIPARTPENDLCSALFFPLKREGLGETKVGIRMRMGLRPTSKVISASALSQYNTIVYARLNSTDRRIADERSPPSTNGHLPR